MPPSPERTYTAPGLQEALDQLERAIGTGKWSEGLACVEALRIRDPGFRVERVSEAEQICLRGQRYDGAVSLLEAGSTALRDQSWEAAAGSLRSAAAVFKEIIVEAGASSLFLESGLLLRQALLQERRIDALRALAEARQAGEDRATQMLEHDLQELNLQLGGFERMQTQAQEAFDRQVAELNSAGWQEVIASLRRIDQLRRQNGWLQDYFVETPLLLVEAQRHRRLSTEVEEATRLLDMESDLSSADLPRVSEAVQALKDVQREAPEFFPERVEPALRSLRRYRDGAAERILSEIEQALDRLQRDRAEQLLTLLVQGAPDVAEQHAPRFGRRVQELRYLESLEAAPPASSPFYGAGSPVHASSAGPATSSSRPASSLGALPAASPYRSPLASQLPSETLPQPERYGALQDAGAGSSEMDPSPYSPNAHGATQKRRVPTKALWVAAAGTAAAVLVGVVLLGMRVAGSGTTSTVVPVANSSAATCEALAFAYARQGGPSQRCIPVDARTALAEVRAGQLDFAITTDDLTTSDSKSLQSTRIFHEVLVFVTSRDRPVSGSLSLGDIAALYSGRGLDPLRGDPACPRPAVFLPNPTSDAWQFLAEKSHVGTPDRALQQVANDDAMIHAVGATECSIGVVTAGTLTGDVKAIPVLGIDPTDPMFLTVLPSYPLARWVYLVQRIPDPNSDKSGRVGTAFLKYILSPQGQKSLAAAGAVPRFQ